MSAIPRSDERHEQCEVCGGIIDTFDSGYFKSPDERFRHALCHEQGEKPGIIHLTDVDESHVQTSRDYNCGHTVHGPPNQHPMFCPECNPVDVQYELSENDAKPEGDA